MAARSPSRTTRPSASSAKPKKRGRWLKRILIFGLVCAIIGSIGLVALYNFVPVPDPNKQWQVQTTRVYYNDGKTSLGKFAEQDRESIPLADVPQHVQDAVVAAEDRTFWTNRGIDIKGIIRAAVSNAQGNATQGASTITQQYVKILYLTSERSLSRKIKEAIVSLKLQKQQTKKQILEGYLNTIYFGRGAYGIQAAARAYFDKPAKDLTVEEGAVLASVLNSPSNFDPAAGKDAEQRLLGRYQYTLRGMASMDTLSSADAEKYAAALPKFPEIKRTQTYGGQRGFMLEMVKNELHNLGFRDDVIAGGGLRVTTTFDQAAMTNMEAAIKAQRPVGKYRGLHIGAASIDVKTGQLLAMYGGQNYLKSQFNWAYKGGQPGSTFKAFAVAAGIQAGFSLKDSFEGNSPYRFPSGLEVKNEGPGNGNSYGKHITMLKALEQSVNTAFIDLSTGLPNQGGDVNKMAYTLGIPDDRTTLEDNITATLGGNTVGVIDMVNAYSTIANLGVEHPWFVVKSVKSAITGQKLYTAPDQSQEVLDPDIAADTSFALQQVVKAGTGRAALSLGRPAAGKTGTATNGDGDVSSAWFVGYTPQIATGVMYVRGKGQEQLDGWLPQYFGGSYPARTWTAIMQSLMADLPVEAFPPPAYVDGEAPATGHEPGLVTPTKTKTPRVTPTPTPTPTDIPTGTPTGTPTSTTSPTSSPSPSSRKGRG